MGIPRNRKCRVGVSIDGRDGIIANKGGSSEQWHLSGGVSGVGTVANANKPRDKGKVVILKIGKYLLYARYNYFVSYAVGLICQTLMREEVDQK